MPENRFAYCNDLRMTVASALAGACEQLVYSLALPKSIARLEARVLAAHVWRVTPAWLIAHDTDRVAEPNFSAFSALVDKRAQGVPIAYITGEREFFGRTFNVTSAVLIPRPETELLVEATLEQIPMQQPFSVLELGTGSGCIAISVALARPHACVTATDDSALALAVARSNASRLEAKIEWLNCHWFSSLAQRKFDCIVSNPPYVACGDPHLASGDLRHEPHSALASGAQGLDDLTHIVANAPKFLRRQGSLLLEHGYDQARAVTELLNTAGFTHIKTLSDLAGRERVTMAKLSV